MREKVFKLTEEIFPLLVKIRRDFHMHPELGLEEYRTSRKIIEYLHQWDIPVADVIRGTSVVAMLEGQAGGKTIALRADMDALPIQEETSAPYASQFPGKMHACGHDAHTAIQLGAAWVLSRLKEEFTGNIKFFFQQAEETVGGAQTMIEAGCLEAPKVDHVLGLHVCPQLETGHIGFKFGRMNAASDALTLNIKGKKAHGAYPQDGIDAIVIASQLVLAVQTIISRNVSPLDAAVLSLGMISGGVAPNVVASQVTLKGTLRTLDHTSRSFILARLFETSRHVGEAFGGEITVAVEPGYDPLINDDGVVERVKGLAEELLGAEAVQLLPDPSLGVEDFAYFAGAVPSCFYRLGIKKQGDNQQATLHESTFDLDEEAMKTGVVMQVMAALGLLDDR